MHVPQGLQNPYVVLLHRTLWGWMGVQHTQVCISSSSSMCSFLKKQIYIVCSPDADFPVQNASASLRKLFPGDVLLKMNGLDPVLVLKDLKETTFKVSGDGGGCCAGDGTGGCDGGDSDDMIVCMAVMVTCDGGAMS